MFIPTAAIVIALLALAAIAPDTATRWFTAAKSWAANDAGWFTILAVAGFLVFVVGVAISSYGRIKLGPDHSTPDYSYGSWFAMLFAAGMGIGLMFFGVAEPIMHYATPPVGSPESAAAARQATRITFFHWGIHAWAIYAVVALSLADFAYRHNLPLRVRSALYPLIGDRIHGPLGHTVDTFAALGTIFGLATSLGLGVMQVNAGLNYLFGLEVSTLAQVGLITVITLVATGSVVAGLDSGVRRLSELNMILAAALLAFVLVCGPSVHLMQALVQNTGMYVSQLFSMTFNLYAYEPTGWLGGWTLFYWGWWIAWSPFVGTFIARISRGRTVREFVVGVLLVPLGFTFLWITIYGNTALHLLRAEGVQQLVQAVSTDSSMALFEFLEHLPLTMLTSSLAVILVALFFVTSSSSASFLHWKRLRLSCASRICRSRSPRGRMVVRGCRLGMARRWTSSTPCGPSPMSRRRSPCRIPVDRSARVPAITARRSICGWAGRTTTSRGGPRFSSSTMCSISRAPPSVPGQGALVESVHRCRPEERHLPWAGRNRALTWPRRPPVLLMVELPRT
ncbi:BCCT family transporter [uncultured Stenotrophomonas sp.]|uniref:BCCT family transporter n=1 Tax=uncultured Stenotrophomonas sp. TaxID=165438 RepID=UPI0025CE2699|nr:BCCT family transporter [uncultured Stenotrophomonas sp.]